jgi:hypothetical protein
MKIKPSHYAAIKNAFITLAPVASSHFDKLLLDKRVKNIGMRFRWDLFYMCLSLPETPRNLMSEIYSYANDSHIDTALIKIMKELDLTK